MSSTRYPHVSIERSHVFDDSVMLVEVITIAGAPPLLTGIFTHGRDGETKEFIATFTHCALREMAKLVEMGEQCFGDMDDDNSE